MHLVSQLVNAYMKIIISSFPSYLNENCVLLAFTIAVFAAF